MTDFKLPKIDEKIINQFFPNDEDIITHYFKTKDNSLRIAFINNVKFIAIETKKAENIFINAVINKTNNNLYTLQEKTSIKDKNNNIKYNIYIGNINL